MLDNQFTPPGVHGNVLMLPLPRSPQNWPRFLVKALSQHHKVLQTLGLAEYSQQLLTEGFPSMPQEWLIFPRPRPSSAPTSWNGVIHIAFLLPLGFVTLGMISAAVLPPQDSSNSIKQRGQPQFHKEMQAAVGRAAPFRGPDFSTPSDMPLSHPKVS